MNYELIELQTHIANWLIWQTGLYGELNMANWFVWRTDYGKLAYGKLENGKITSYHKNVCI